MFAALFCSSALCRSLLPTMEEFPLDIGKAFAFVRADSIGILRIKTNLPVFIDHLWVERKDHVFFQDDIAFCSNGGMLDHGHAYGVAGKMAERKAVFGKCICDRSMHCARQFAGSHESPSRFERLGIGVRHGLRGGAWFSAQQRP